MSETNPDGYRVPRTPAEVGDWLQGIVEAADPNTLLHQLRDNVPTLFDPAFIPRGIMFDDEEELWCDLAHASFKLLGALGETASVDILAGSVTEIALIYTSLGKLARIRDGGVPE